MNVLSRAWNWLNETEDTQTRSLESFEFTPLGEQVAAFHGIRSDAWRPSSISTALGVPAILRAVSLIANTTGSLSMRAYRNGASLTDPPRIVQRPNPFCTPREFFRDTAYYLATRGEAIWWIAARDIDGLPASLIVVPIQELTIEKNPRDRRFPIYRWGKTTSTAFSGATPGGDFVHITYLREPGQLRGKGPLQICGAAISVTVEAQEWAANFFAGDTSSTELKSLVDIDETEADSLLKQWMERKHAGLPRVTNPTLDWREHQVDPQSAQMVEARSHQDGEAARMFGIPGTLLEYAAPGSSLTYQNVEGEYTKFVRTCLAPNYLEPIEQAITDLLTRSTTARFAVDGLLRADIKTRYEVYKTGIEAGVLIPAEARRLEGLDPGDIEVAPVPYAFPAAVPASLPESRSMQVVEDDARMMFAEAMMKLATRAEAAPIVNVHPSPVNVHPSPVTIERGAIQVEGTDLSGLTAAFEELASKPPPEVNIAAPDMTSVAEALTTLSELVARPIPAPEVTVNPPEVRVEAAQVTVNVPEQPVPVIDSKEFAKALDELKHEIRAPRKRRIVRDQNNVITGVVEEPI